MNATWLPRRARSQIKTEGNSSGDAIKEQISDQQPLPN
jgi:hypothetical protein